jgi:type I restriction enzyme S subunit
MSYINSNAMALDNLDDSLCSIDYLALYLKQRGLDDVTTGAAQPQITRGNLEKVKIPLPSLNDQKRIAHLLGKVEALIVQRKQNLQQLDALLKSVFFDMFGDPVRNDNGWVKKPLAMLGELDRGVSKHRPRNAPRLLGGEYPLIQTGDVSNSGIFITKYTRSYSEFGLAQSKLWPAGTLCITIAANIAQTGILKFDACFPDSVVGFSVKKGLSEPLYVIGLFWFFQSILEESAPAAAQKNINLKILRELEVPFPPLKIQKKFARLVQQVEDIKIQYQQSLNDLENLYGALSQKAFKGELDLSQIPLLEEDTEVNSDANKPQTTESAPAEKTEFITELRQLDSGSFTDKKSREKHLRQWFNEWLTSSSRNSELTLEDFWSSAGIKALDYILEDDDNIGFNVSDYDLIKAELFTAIENGTIEQITHMIEIEVDGKKTLEPGNQIILKKLG